MAREMAIKITKSSGNVRDVISLTKHMVDKMGYTKAKLQLALIYGIEITIDYRELAI